MEQPTSQTGLVKQRGIRYAYFLELIENLCRQIMDKDQIESWELGKEELISEFQSFLDSEMSDFIVAAASGLDLMQKCLPFLSEESRDFLSARIINLHGLVTQIEIQKLKADFNYNKAIDTFIQVIRSHLQEIIQVLASDR